MSGESKELTVLAASRVGTTVGGKWMLERLIGVGRITAVFEAVNSNGRRVAIKSLHPELSGQLPIRACFFREAYAANAVGHPGAVTVYDDGFEEGLGAYLVMEFVEGQTLEGRVRSQWALEPVEVVGVSEQILFTLRAAHRHGIVHLAIKPSNIAFPVTGGVKLFEFGMAPVRELAAALGSIPVGSIAPAPERVAPEHASGRWDTVDARSDLWAVGSAMFFMLSGQHVVDVANQGGTSGEPLSVLQCCPGLEPSLAEVVDRALAEQPSQRWCDADEMLIALSRARSAVEESSRDAADWGHEELPTLPVQRSRELRLEGAAVATKFDVTTLEVVTTTSESGAATGKGGLPSSGLHGSVAESGEPGRELDDVGSARRDASVGAAGDAAAAGQALDGVAGEAFPAGSGVGAAGIVSSPVVSVGVAADSREDVRRDATELPDVLLAEARGEVGSLLLESPLRPSGTPGASPNLGRDVLDVQAKPEPETGALAYSAQLEGARFAAGEVPHPPKSALVDSPQAAASSGARAGSLLEEDGEEAPAMPTVVRGEGSMEGRTRPDAEVATGPSPTEARPAARNLEPLVASASGPKAFDAKSYAENEDEGEVNYLAGLVGPTAPEGAPGEATGAQKSALLEGDVPRTTLPSGDSRLLAGHAQPADGPLDTKAEESPMAGGEAENESEARLSQSERAVLSRVKAAPTVIVQVDDEDEQLALSEGQRLTTPAARAVPTLQDSSTEGLWRSAAIVLASALVTLLLVSGLVKYFAPEGTTVERIRSKAERAEAVLGDGNEAPTSSSQDVSDEASKARGEAVSLEELPVDDGADQARVRAAADRARALARARELALQSGPDDVQSGPPSSVASESGPGAPTGAQAQATPELAAPEPSAIGVAPDTRASTATVPPATAELVPAGGVTKTPAAGAVRPPTAPVVSPPSGPPSSSAAPSQPELPPSGTPRAPSQPGEGAPSAPAPRLPPEVAPAPQSPPSTEPSNTPVVPPAPSR